MATLKELHDLVHALDKYEKKHVSLLIDTLGGKAKERYARAFRIINEQKEFDSDKLKEKLSTGVSGMNLTEANSNVYDFISRVMVSYEQEGQMGLTNQLTFIEFLISKKLLDAAHRALQKIEPEIESKGSFAQIQRLYEIQEQITIQHPVVNADYEYRSAFFAKRAASIETLRQLIGFLHIQFLFFKAAKEFGLPRTREQVRVYQDLWENPLLKMNADEVEERMLPYYYNMKANIAEALFHADAVACSLQYIKDYQQTSAGKENKSAQALLLSTYLNMLITADKIDHADLIWARNKLLNTLNDIPHKATRAQRYAKLLMAELAYYIKSGKYGEGIAYYEQILKDAERENWQDSMLNYAIPWFGARLYYLAQNPDKALDSLLMIREQEKTMRFSIYINYKFLSLLCHYMLGNQILVDSVADSLYRSLLKQEKLYEPERALLRFVKKSGPTDHVKQKMQELYDTLLELKEDLLNRAFFTEGDYMEWLEMELKRWDKK